jgi:GNAT superfamily N-acetyltransferase
MMTMRNRAPPAWRSLQTIPSELEGHGKLFGSPPCLNGLLKEGRGDRALWALASYHSEQPLEVHLQLDRNPTAPCCKLMFRRPDTARQPGGAVSAVGAVGAVGEAGSGQRVGHVLLRCGEDSSTLRGMFIAESMRNRGLSKVLLAVWLRMCDEAGLRPATAMINKPLLSLSLGHFGFTPTNQRGQLVTISAPKRLRAAIDASEVTAGSTLGTRKARSAYIRTEFEPPMNRAVLEAAVNETLGGRLCLTASASHLRRALTLRGGRRGETTSRLQLGLMFARTCFLRHHHACVPYAAHARSTVRSRRGVASGERK